MKKISAVYLCVIAFICMTAISVQGAGDRAIFNAVFDGNVPALKKLIDGGSDINQRDVRKKTPLMIASEKGRLDAVNFLVEQGADIHLTVNGRPGGYTALTLAAINKHADVAIYLIDKGAKIEKGDVMYAASGSCTLLKYMADKGADMNAVHSRNMTALIYAAGNGNLDAVKFLVDKGVNIKAADKQGQTALDWARKNKRAAVVAYHESKMK